MEGLFYFLGHTGIERFSFFACLFLSRVVSLLPAHEKGYPLRNTTLPESRLCRPCVLPRLVLSICPASSFLPLNPPPPSPHAVTRCPTPHTFSTIRPRAHVSIAEPSSVLLGLVTRLLVTVSAPPRRAAAGAPGRASGIGGGGDGCCGKPPHPFRDGFLHLECEPAPVPPPIVAPLSSSTAGIQGPAGETSPPEPEPAPAPGPARPRPERAFFWAPPNPDGGGGGGVGGAAAGVAVADGKGGFLPVVVGADGQPVEGIPLPLPLSSGAASEQVTVPVWVRSETAGKVAVRARVVYGMGGKSPGSGVSAGPLEGGGAVTEWARAEVLCVRPLGMVVDVVSLQHASEEDRGGGGGEGAGFSSLARVKRSGHTVAVKVFYAFCFCVLVFFFVVVESTKSGGVAGRGRRSVRRSCCVNGNGKRRRSGSVETKAGCQRASECLRKSVQVSTSSPPI